MKEGRITTLKDIQLIANLWQSQIVGEEDMTPQSRFNRMMDEVHEAQEEVQRLNPSRTSEQRLASELGDVIFVAIGVLSVLNVSLEDELNRIISTNYKKYSPYENKKLREQGMSHQQAIDHQKTIFKRNGK
jgi:NTP pyrophosphatase (non-canonical NTP hydrolase)